MAFAPVGEELFTVLVAGRGIFVTVVSMAPTGSQLTLAPHLQTVIMFFKPPTSAYRALTRSPAHPFLLLPYNRENSLLLHAGNSHETL